MVVVMALALAAAAQQEGDGSVSQSKAAPAASPAKPASKRLAAAAEEKRVIRPVKREPAADQPEEEGSVMIDDRAEGEPRGRFSDNEAGTEAETGETNTPGGMPASYGQLKGTLSEGGKNFLIFENEDGALSFVQVFAGRNSVSWKLVSRIPRSAD
jgi:hypothetical protein